MTAYLSHIHLPLWLNGQLLSPEKIRNGDFFGTFPSSFEKSIVEFLQQWYNEDQRILFQTSGTTGAPKPIYLKKECLLASARQTNEFFKITAGNKGLLALSPKFIGGAMMIVRAICGGMHLYSCEPNQLEKLPETTFKLSAFVPLQLEKLLSMDVVDRLFENILLGGVSTSSDLIEKIQQLTSARIFATFGMTETASHIALRNLSAHPAEEAYTFFPGVDVKLNEVGCLEVRGSMTSNEWITTGDLVELNGRTMKFLGRNDHVINSGGIKIFPETTEEIIKSNANGSLEFLHTTPFALIGVPDESLGQRLMLVVESSTVEANLSDLDDVLEKYHRPKELKFIPKFPRTESGKIMRKELTSWFS